MRKARLLTVLSGLILLTTAVLVGASTARSRQADDLDALLEGRAAQASALIESSFVRGSTVSLLLARSPVFRELYVARQDGVDDERDARARVAVDDALRYLGSLYPDSISEACLIDAGGEELARIVRGVAAPAGDLSPDESGRVFFSPALAQPAGVVYHSAPYVSPDTGEKALAVATSVQWARPSARGIVHFELTLESLRRDLADLGFPVQVLDRDTGRVVLDSAVPIAATTTPSAEPASVVGGDGTGARTTASPVTVGDLRAAMRAVPTSAGNANAWVVVAHAPVVGMDLRAALDRSTIALVLGALLLIGAAVVGLGLAERREAAERLQAADRLASLVNNVSDMVTVVDADGIVRFVAGPIEAAFGTSAEALVGTQFVALAHEDDRQRAEMLLGEVREEPGATLTAVWRMRTAAGGWGQFETTATNLLEHESVRGVVLTTHDVTQRHEMEEQLRHRAFHDPLTHLANRALFYDRVEHALAYERRHDHIVAVLFIDLDDFKLVNDRYGHGAGDELLVAIAGRLKALLRAGDTAARLGGDEFGILVEGIGGVADALAVADRIVEAFREPVVVMDEILRVTPTIGVSDSGTVPGGADELLAAADVAMYAAKRLGKDRYELYTREIENDYAQHRSGADEGAGWYVRSDEQRAEVEAILDRDDAIAPVFQPILDLRTGALVGYEALARFRGRADRPPNAWFAQAHRFGLGPRLEALAVRAALGSTGRPPGTQLWMNVSPSALVSADVQDVLPERLDDVVLELTENELISEAAHIDTVLARLRERGVRVAIDDAGSGYAGLRQLMRLRPEIIKLDRALVQGVSRDPTKAALIESFVRYAAKIGGHLCAEGIEDVDDLVALADLDVTYGQGYAAGRPAAAWPTVEREAAEACAAALRGALGGRGGAEVASSAAERHLERIASRLGEVASLSQLEQAMVWVAEELNAEKAALFAYRSRTRMLEVLSAPARSGTQGRMRVDDLPISRRILETRAMDQVLLGDPAADAAEVQLLRDEQARSMLVFPVLSAGQAVGLMRVYARDERPWSREEMNRARIIATGVGPVLDRLLVSHTLQLKDLVGSS